MLVLGRIRVVCCWLARRPNSCGVNIPLHQRFVCSLVHKTQWVEFWNKVFFVFLRPMRPGRNTVARDNDKHVDLNTCPYFSLSYGDSVLKLLVGQ